MGIYSLGEKGTMHINFLLQVSCKLVYNLSRRLTALISCPGVTYLSNTVLRSGNNFGEYSVITSDRAINEK